MRQFAISPVRQQYVIKYFQTETENTHLFGQRRTSPGTAMALLSFWLCVYLLTASWLPSTVLKDSVCVFFGRFICLIGYSA